MSIFLCQITLEADDRAKLYLGAESTLYYPSADVTIGAMRCWLELKGGLKAGDPSNGVNTFNLNFDGEANGIQAPAAIELPLGDGHWFTIDGRRLSTMLTQKGIYICNGKKVVIK